MRWKRREDPNAPRANFLLDTTRAPAISAGWSVSGVLDARPSFIESRPMPLAISILADGFVFLEGPRWHDGRLFVSDMHDDRVLAVGPGGRVERILDVPAQPSGLGWLPDGRMLVVSMTDRKLLRVDPGGVVVHADLAGIATFHCNDMVVDLQGRAYVGNFGWDYESGAPQRKAALALVHPDGHVVRAADDLSFPNGTGLTPDGGTLIVGQTFARRLTAFDVAPAARGLSHP